MVKSHGMSSEQASWVKLQGHKDAIEFAHKLGIGEEFKSEPNAKKDIIDKNGYSYSVKSGKKKWQIFLYRKTRFNEDFAFQGINRLGELFIRCIDSFPEKRSDYLKNKSYFKTKLKEPMQELANELSNTNILRAFLEKSFFNGNEVDFLVIKNNGLFHVFYNRDVVSILSDNISVENSKKRNRFQMDSQKVVFKVRSENKFKTLGEIEMRNDSDVHYREIKFWVFKQLTFDLLITNTSKMASLNQFIILYDTSIRKLKKYFSII